MPRPWYRHLWPWLLIALPLLSVVIGSGVTLWLALSHKDPLVIESQRYDTLRQELRAQKQAVTDPQEVEEPRQGDG